MTFKNKTVNSSNNKTKQYKISRKIIEWFGLLKLE
jgi:hypothetical protein